MHARGRQAFSDKKASGDKKGLETPCLLLAHRDRYAWEPNVGFRGTAEVARAFQDRETAVADVTVARNGV
jgi:hypothetical protein